LETYTETKDITDSDGNTFTCLYSLVYDANRKVVYRRQSSVKCEPNTNGRQTVEDVVIEAIGKKVSVTYQPRPNKTGIKKVVLSNYVAPATEAPATEAPTEAPAVTGTAEGSMMDCTCKPNTTMMEAMMSEMESEMSSMTMPAGRAIRYLKKSEGGMTKFKPMPVKKLSVASVRQFLLQGLIDSQTQAIQSNAEEMAMEMMQQQIEEMLASGQLEQMVTEFVSSGQLEQMATEFMSSPETEQMMDEIMAEVMRPPTDEEMEQMMAMMESMKPSEEEMQAMMESMKPTEEEKAEMEAQWQEMMSMLMSEEEMAQMQTMMAAMENMENNGGLMGMMESMGMNGGMAEMMGKMEMQLMCKCSPSTMAMTMAG